jgi:pimeloyl-ACP methyl ester carboxylesterase
MMLVEMSFDTGEVLLNYAEGPDNGPPVLFIHGISGRWQYWYPILTQLSMRWHVYAVDLRGHGNSEWKTGHYTLEDYRRDIVSFIEKVVKKPVTLVGHSLGAMISTVLAASHPENIVGVVLGDPPCNFDESIYDMLAGVGFWWELTMKAAKAGSLEDTVNVLRESIPDSMSEMKEPIELLGTANSYSRIDPDIESLLAKGAEDHSYIKEWLAGYDCGLLYPKLRCPVLFIRGKPGPGMGGAISDIDYEKAKKSITNLIPVYLETHGHDVYHNSVEPALGMITTFLESLR